MKIDVGKVATLANLKLTPDEEKKYSEQLSKVLDYVGELNRAPTSGVSATYNVSPNSNVMRPDTVGESLTQEEAISNAPNTKEGFIVTKSVSKQE